MLLLLNNLLLWRGPHLCPLEVLSVSACRDGGAGCVPEGCSRGTAHPSQPWFRGCAACTEHCRQALLPASYQPVSKARGKERGSGIVAKRADWFYGEKSRAVRNSWGGREGKEKRKWRGVHLSENELWSVAAKIQFWTWGSKWRLVLSACATEAWHPGAQAVPRCPFCHMPSWCWDTEWGEE